MKESVTDLISVIIPVYNVEKYLDKCLDSLVNQTYKNIEIIVVDDGSPDNCPVICDEWAKKDNRIKVIHKENGGLSSARNTGIDIASGEFVAFVDSDDWVDLNTLEVAYKMISSGNYDLSIYSLLPEYGTETEQYISGYDTNYCDRKELFGLILNDNYVCGYACNKLFKRTLIGDLRFDESLLSCEDIDFCAKYAAKCKNAVYTTAKFYHYRQRNDSMTGEYKYNVRKLSVLTAYENIMPIFREYDFEDYYKLERNYLKIALNIKGRMILSKVNDNDVSERLEKIIKEYYSKVIRNSDNSVLIKANIIFTRLFPGLLLKMKQFVLKMRRGLND